MPQIKAIDFGIPNAIQKSANDAFREGKRIVLINTGRQAGKSHYGARWLISQTMNPQDKNKLAAGSAYVPYGASSPEED
jgi:phage terminase large subunit-like protein